MKPLIVFLTWIAFVGQIMAVEIAQVEHALASLGQRQKLLDLVVTMGLSKRATWQNVEPLILKESESLGKHSISVKVPKSRSIRSIVLIGDSNQSSEDANMLVDAVTITTKDGMFTYRFSTNSKGYVKSGAREPASPTPARTPAPR